MYHTIHQIIEKIDFNTIPDERKIVLDELVDAVKESQKKNDFVRLHFICTHNSRRSQFGQLWASVASHYYQFPIQSFSGGMEITEFNERAIASLIRFGFQISNSGSHNRRYTVEFNAGDPPVHMYSKLVEDEVNPTENFIAIMTCSDADEKCPLVIGCEARIALRYNDPKYFDGSPLEATMYDYRSFQIATELFYVFSKLV
jgi:arsenate reductase